MSWFCYFSKCIQQNASQCRRLWYFMIPCQCVCVFYIKFYVSWSLSYCWAIRPPPSSFFLPLPLPSALPLLCSHSGFYLFFCLFLSLRLISPSFCHFLLLHFSFTASLPVFYLSDFLCLTLSLSPSLLPASLSLPLFCFLPPLFLKLLVADGSRALFILSLLVSVFISGRSHSLSSRHRLPTAPRNKHTKWFPARSFCLRWGWRKTKKNRGFM